jgi:hypothetical protein
MRKNLWLLGVLSLLVAAAPSSFGEGSSCTAPDGSCSASVSCSGGCMEILGSGGNCGASCSGDGGKPQEEQPGLRTEQGAIGVAPGAPAEGAQRVSVEAHDLAADDVSALLSSLAGLDLPRFRGHPSKPENGRERSRRWRGSDGDSARSSSARR